MIFQDLGNKVFRAMSDTEGFIIKWESTPWGDVEFDGEIFEKNRRMRRG